MHMALVQNLLLMESIYYTFTSFFTCNMYVHALPLDQSFVRLLLLTTLWENYEFVYTAMYHAVTVVHGARLNYRLRQSV